MGRIQAGNGAILINCKKVLAIIPARGGSKRLSNKNLLHLLGKPLFVWSIEAGIKSIYVDKVIVSSDSENILNISSKSGVEIIERPRELATDESTTFSVVEHVINNINCSYDIIILLQPTSPLRNHNHIDEAFQVLKEKKADAVISVCKSNHNPLWANVLPKDGNMKLFLSDFVKNKRSQDLPTYFQLNGCIYICETNRLLNEKSFFIKDRIYAYKMDKNSSIDIDDEFDYKMAEIILSSL